MVTEAPISWLRDSDPALRWQVERDLMGEQPEVWEATRARIASEGVGARLLALQDADGQWAGGSFFPADFDFSGPEAAEDAGQPWTATTWTLNSNCEWIEGSTRSSFHSTLNSLWGLLAYEVATGGTDATHAARSSGEEYLLRRGLFRQASLLDGAPPDPRMAEAVELIRAARQPDGTWLQARRQPGRVWFEVDAPAGQPSKWLTLFGTRVLTWWDRRTR